MTISSLLLSKTPGSVWAEVFDSAPMVREKMMDLLEHIRVELDTECETFDTPATWDQLLAALKSVGHRVKQESLIGLYYIVDEGNTPAVYAMPEYGWDGGAPISTCTFNLESVASSHIGGSTASLVQRKDPSRPGVILHRECEFGTVVFQIC